ncbi:hypothetical protein ONV75_16545 [Clostridium sp. LQ25]|uniref:PBECR3 domain-containing polyvalent protein n=1 Tax=Clostridium sp. LQ25 TaxID=2992805 RepID=UPI00224D8C1F|nr:hypothetical protein [Clostridium sp. LQ25]UZT06190.1 hypothetical protein ONV75_16545 [Clostridium sp. LQ25]
MEYYYEELSMIFKIKTRIHNKVILYNKNYKNHIKNRHPEMTLNKIQKILEEPDFIYTNSKSSGNYYYEKNFGKYTYRVVVKTCRKHVKEVVTAYKVDKKKDAFTIKHVYCIYDKDTFWNYDERKLEREQDIDYFYELFNIAK